MPVLEQDRRGHLPPHLLYDTCALRMLQSLLRELHDSEEATRRWAIRDARCYDGVELGAPFYALAAHAGASVKSIEEVARARGVRRERATRLVRRLLGRARDLYRVRFHSAERAYRGTISRVRDGIDLARLVRSTAEGGGDHELVRLCDEWLALRIALVETMTEQIEWFADRPRVSMETAHCIARARLQLGFTRPRTPSRAELSHEGGYGRLLASALPGVAVPASNLQ
jgi:hypothetical protein